MATIIIVDDEPKISKLLTAELSDAGHVARGFTSPRQALEAVRSTRPDILLTDLRMQELDGISLLREARRAVPELDVVVMTAYASVETALETMKQGAYDYIIKPFKTDELLMLIERIDGKRRLQDENQELRSYLAGGLDDEIVGSSQTIARVKEIIANLGSSEAPVLIRGESGTGKELVARAVHKTSARASGPFIAINCAAIPETLLESELFGYERGAFTGANRKKLGHFQLADGGTLFLDEIGDLPAALQSKLLRVLENNEVRPLGAEKEVRVDIRLITATNRPLEDNIRSGSFREDLYYRINVFPIELPALRERREDVGPIARHLLARVGRNAGELTDDALRKLQIYHWPGNVRELRNVLERAMIVRPQGAITADDIILGTAPSPTTDESTPESLNIEDMERRLIRQALRVAQGNKSEAARLLGITRRALYGRLERYGLED
jgi:two-component system response regulator HydG